MEALKRGKAIAWHPPFCPRVLMTSGNLNREPASLLSSYREPTRRAIVEPLRGAVMKVPVTWRKRLTTFLVVFLGVGVALAALWLGAPRLVTLQALREARDLYRTLSRDRAANAEPIFEFKFNFNFFAK